jgi:tetratricopeptide (TPR) repeat protein
VKSPDPHPLIIGFVADLIFASHIENAAENLGYRVHWIERLEQLASPEAGPQDRQLGEHLTGPGGALIEQVTALHPALIIFDLGNPHVPWRQWVALLKSVSATRRYPLICYGSHVDADTLRAAEHAGADAVLPRSRFMSDLPAVIQQYARQVDYAALQDTCRQPLSSLALHGLELFNRGEYFEAHEALEKAWNEDDTPGRELYRAILQVAVAYLQIERGNYNGAMKMFLRLRQWIDPLPDTCRGVDVGRLRSDARRAYEMLLALGRPRIAEFDRNLFRPVVYTASP